ILNIYLSLPIPRWRLVTGRVLGAAVLIVGVLVLSFAGLVVGIVLTPSLAEVRIPRIAESTVNMLPSLLVALAFTVVVAAVLRRRSLILTIIVSYVFGGYFLDTLGASATGTIVNTL